MECFGFVSPGVGGTQEPHFAATLPSNKDKELKDGQSLISLTQILNRSPRPRPALVLVQSLTLRQIYAAASSVDSIKTKHQI